MKILHIAITLCLLVTLAACSSGPAKKRHASLDKKEVYQPALYNLEEEPQDAFVDPDVFFNFLLTSVDYNEKQTALIELGKQYLGSSYVFGGATPEAGGFDCSGFTQYVYQNSLNMSLPRRSRDMATVGIPVAYHNIKAGDLVFFNTLGAEYSHVGIYIGDGMFFHASPSWGSIVIADMTKEYFTKRYNGARRVLKLSDNPNILAAN